MDRLKCIRTFVHIGRSSSLSAAAAELGISRSLASSHLMQLEEHLGTKLVTRTTRQCRLTSAGEEYLQLCLSALKAFDEADAKISYLQAEMTGPIKVMASIAFGTFQLGPVITAFSRAHPHVVIALSLFDRSFSSDDFIDGGFDVGFSTHPMRQGELISTKVSETLWIPCATTEYLEDAPPLRAPLDLKEHSCLIHQTHAPKGTWAFSKQGRRVEVLVTGPLTTNSSAVLRGAALSSLGIAMLPYYMVDVDLKTGQLQHVLPDFTPFNRPIFLVYPPTKQLPNRVRAFIDYVKAQFNGKKR